VHPGEDLHQRGLAGAVLPDQRVRLAAAEVERGVEQGGDRAEGLARALEPQQRRGGRGAGLAVRVGQRFLPAQVMNRSTSLAGGH
jgi:hypothetical protein